MLAIRPGKSSLARSRSPSVVPPTKELEEALSNFEKSLSGERRKQFQALRSADDSYDTNAAQILLASVKKEKDSRRRSRTLLKIQGFLEAAQEFSAIVDNIAGINPIAGAVWGGVKLFIIYAIKFTHFTDDLMTCLNQVQNICPRFKAYGSLYQSSQELKQAICDYYAVVFRFITKAISELEKPGLSAAWSYIKSPLKSELSNFKDDLSKSGENVNLYIVFAKGQADMIAQEEVQKHNNLVKKAWDQLLKREQDQRLVKGRNSARSQRHELLKRLSDHEYKRLPKDLRKKALYGPDGPWLLQTSQYTSWKTVQDSAIFLLSVGSGKSVLSTEVLDDLLVQHRNLSKTALCFFFCDARQQKESSLLAKTILGSLCRQYLQHTGDLDTVEPALDDFFESSSSPNAGEMADFFTFCVDGSMMTYIILDGLDDCNSVERTIVLTALSDIMSCARQTQFGQSKNIKLFITFSLANDIQLQKLLRADYQQHTTSSEASHDFTRAIDRMLQEKKEKGMWKFHDEGLFLDVSHALHKGSQNMLLWASLMIDEICAQHRITDVRNIIREDRLPKDLHSVYDLALGRIEQTECQEYAARMFNAVAAARRPISLLEIAEIVVIEPCQPSWNPEDRIAVPEDMMSWVANLLILDEEDKTLAFTHHSVVNFLTLTKSATFKLNLRDADLALGNICVTYLNFRELQGQLVLRQEMRPRSQLHPMRLASTALSSAGGNQSWTKLLTKITLKIRPENGDPQRRSNSPGAKSIETLKAELQQLQSVFYLLAYASEFWLDHSSELDPSPADPSIIILLWRKLLTSPNPAAARPWDPEPWDSGLRSLQYAIDSQHVALFRCIWDSEAGYSIPTTLSQETAHTLLRSQAMLRPEQATQWLSSEFFNSMRNWHKVFISPDPWSEFMQLEKHRPAIVSYDSDQKLLLLQHYASRALLASILNDFTLPEIWDLTLLVGRARSLLELNYVSTMGFNYLSAAAAYNNTTFIESFCDPEDSYHRQTLHNLLAGVKFNTGSFDFDTVGQLGQALVLAAIRDNTESCDRLLGLLQTYVLDDIFLQMALIISSRAGNLEVVRMLLATGASPKHRAGDKLNGLKPYSAAALLSRNFTALMAAAMGDHAEVVELLLQSGALRETVDMDDKTALMYAKSETVRRLLASDPSGTAGRPGSPSRSFHSRYSDSDIEY